MLSDANTLVRGPNGSWPAARLTQNRHTSPLPARGLSLIRVVVQAPRGFGSIARVGTARPPRWATKTGIREFIARDPGGDVDPWEENRKLIRLDRLLRPQVERTEHLAATDLDGRPVAATIRVWIVRLRRFGLVALLAVLRAAALAARRPPEPAAAVPEREPEARPPPAELVSSLTAAPLAPPRVG